MYAKLKVFQRVSLFPLTSISISCQIINHKQGRLITELDWLALEMCSLLANCWHRHLELFLLQEANNYQRKRTTLAKPGRSCRRHFTAEIDSQPAKQSVGMRQKNCLSDTYSLKWKILGNQLLISKLFSSLLACCERQAKPSSKAWQTQKPKQNQEVNLSEVYFCTNYAAGNSVFFLFSALIFQDAKKESSDEDDDAKVDKATSITYQRF